MYMDIIGMSIDINILQNEDPLMKEHLRQEDCIGMVIMSVTDSKECRTGLVCTLLPYIYELRMKPHDDIHTTEAKKYKKYNNDVVAVSKTDEIFSYARPSDMTKRYAYQSILNALNFMKYIIDDCVTDEIVAHEALFN